jgi:chromosome segregation ATPase
MMDYRKRSSQLVIANKRLAYQNLEKEKRAAELLVVLDQLALQNHQMEERAAELVIANRELAYQNQEKEKRAAELSIANHELAFQNSEKEKRAAELILANHELAFQNKEKESRAAELVVKNNELGKAEEYLKEHIVSLEEMMFMTSHKVRQPVANILGLANILGQLVNSHDELMTSVGCIKDSAEALDSFIKEFTNYIVELDQKWKNTRFDTNS